MTQNLITRTDLHAMLDRLDGFRREASLSPEGEAARDALAALVPLAAEYAQQVTAADEAEARAADAMVVVDTATRAAQDAKDAGTRVIRRALDVPGYRAAEDFIAQFDALKASV
jgi:hypothetical protein